MSPARANDAMPATLSAGHPWPLGAHWDGDGVNFAVFSAHAQRIELCLFDAADPTREVARLTLPSHTDDIWHGYLEGAAPGLVYGLRAHGPWRPDKGHLFNPNKLLLDPYARAIVGDFHWRDEHFGADRRHPQHMDGRDNAPFALKARVLAEPVAEPRRHASPAQDDILYELHVKGFSKLNPEVPEALRGTYAGLADPASIRHLQRLGVTAVSLLPVHYHLDEERLAGLGLVNYWGYNTLGFFAPDPRLASGANGLSVRDEFRAMVRALHAAGIQVILDVVYNHTAEGGEGGPSLSFRGLDNAAYYRLRPHAPQHYENYTGCGNTLDMREPRVLQLVLDSLRYWAGEMGVDGFRFDLAPVLGRGEHGFDRGHAFFTAIAQDPLLSRLRMIAEPWDVGHGGYQVGHFPRGWREWNDRFRDTMRGFWLTGANARDAFALRLCGSSDLYQARGRKPAESVNYVVSHDGFTLADLVSYAQRHNYANGEHNCDGHAHNLSTNCGIEGPTDDAAVLQRRARLRRALLACTVLAQGTPMLAAGDELLHSQDGNNNPYCQDNALSWIDWQAADADMIEFVAYLVGLRKQARPFANRWYTGLSDSLGLHDLSWFEADGSPLHGHAWHDPHQRVLACLIGHPGNAKSPLLLIVNADADDRHFRLPAGAWHGVLDTADARGRSHWQGQGDVELPIAAHSLHLYAAAGAWPGL